MTFNTSLTRLLRIEHPVILAPMGFVSGGALAGAVSAAGGFGIIGAVMRTPTGWNGNSARPATTLWAAASSPGRWRNGLHRSTWP